MGVGTIVAGILIAFFIIVIVGIAIMAGISHSIDVQEKEKAAWNQSKLKARQAEADAEVYCIQRYSHVYCGGLSLEEK